MAVKLPCARESWWWWWWGKGSRRKLGGDGRAESVVYAGKFGGPKCDFLQWGTDHRLSRYLLPPYVMDFIGMRLTHFILTFGIMFIAIFLSVMDAALLTDRHLKLHVEKQIIMKG